MKNINKEFLQEIVKLSSTWADVARHLGLRVHGGNYRTIQKYISQYKISTEHFTFKPDQSLKCKYSLDEILVENSPYRGGTALLKKRLLKEKLLREECYETNCPTKVMPNWNGKGFNLQLDHIDGNRSNNLLINLRLLCPICHTHTSTYGGKNKTRKIKDEKYCVDCRKKISKTGTRCKSCALKFSYQEPSDKLKNKSRITKIDWPSVEELKVMLEQSNYLAVAKKLGVSDNAVRKRIKTRCKITGCELI